MKGNVLLIDDNEMDLRVMTSALERQGFACFAFTDFEKGLAWAVENHPKMIFLDLQMPGVTGYELIPRFKAMPHLADVSILIVSGRNEIESVKKAIQLGAADYIIKPVDPLVLQEKARKTEGKLGDDEFSQVALDPEHASAMIGKPFEILRVSEFGLAAKLPEPVRPNTTLELAGLSAEIFGVVQLAVRCLSSEAAPAGGHIVQFTFVGLTENQRQHIRKACRKIWVQRKQEAQ